MQWMKGEELFTVQRLTSRFKMLLDVDGNALLSNVSIRVRVRVSVRVRYADGNALLSNVSIRVRVRVSVRVKNIRIQDAIRT
jgi:hypothetical protein